MIWQLENMFKKEKGKLSFVDRRTLKWMPCDGGGEYVGQEFSEWPQKK